MTRYVAYCDGACSKKGIGGAGAFITAHQRVVSSVCLSQNKTTNNQMELSAALLALQMFKQLNPTRNDSLIIYTDSQYTQKGLTEWIFGWIKKGWNTTSGPVANAEIWKRLLSLYNSLKHKHQIEIRWVRGHAGNSGNEVADYIATKLRFDSPESDNAEENLSKKILLEYGKDGDIQADPSSIEVNILSLDDGNGDILDALDIITAEGI